MGVSYSGASDATGRRAIVVTAGQCVWKLVAPGNIMHMGATLHEMQRGLFHLHGGFEQ